MYQIEDQIGTTEFNGLKPIKLASKDNCETILIVLEKGHTFPEHISPRDALLVMLEGSITFHINNNEYKLKKHQSFTFPSKVAHKVLAEENSKFLIVR
jgi:quercetin dioxygenase-like cupin family protein